eukprot:scaffold1347_cov174-Skeletonema_dohrnii-CCMP3373.AAC.1
MNRGMCHCPPLLRASRRLRGECYDFGSGLYLFRCCKAEDALAVCTILAMIQPLAVLKLKMQFAVKAA